MDQIRLIVIYGILCNQMKFTIMLEMLFCQFVNLYNWNKIAQVDNYLLFNYLHMVIFLQFECVYKTLIGSRHVIRIPNIDISTRLGPLTWCSHCAICNLNGKY